jgi:hypothetical protein
MKVSIKKAIPVLVTLMLLLGLIWCWNYTVAVNLIPLVAIGVAFKISDGYRNKNAAGLMIDYAFLYPLASVLTAYSITELFNLKGDASYLAYVISFIVIVGLYHPYVLWKYYVKHGQGHEKELIHITDKAKEVIVGAGALMLIVTNLPLVTKIVGETFPINDDGFKKLTLPILFAYAVLRQGIDYVMRKRYEKHGNRYKVD